MNTHFGGAHGTGQGYHHLAAFGEVQVVAVGRVNEGGGVEMPVMVAEKVGDLHFSW